jgi:hypothetical protein
VAADTHLKNDAEIVLRLFTAAWETGNDEGARAWCDLLAERIGTGVAGGELPDAPHGGRNRSRSREARSDTEPGRDVAVLVQRCTSVRRPGGRFSTPVPGNRSRAREILAGLPAALASSELPYLQAWAWLELGEVELARAMLERPSLLLPLLSHSFSGVGDS